MRRQGYPLQSRASSDFVSEQTVMVRLQSAFCSTPSLLRPHLLMTRPACGVQDVPLPELFRQAQELAEQAAAMPGKEAETRARQAETLHTLARCDQLVDSHAFFSRWLPCPWRLLSMQS